MKGSYTQCICIHIISIWKHNMDTQSPDRHSVCYVCSLTRPGVPYIEKASIDIVCSLVQVDIVCNGWVIIHMQHYSNWISCQPRKDVIKAVATQSHVSLTRHKLWVSVLFPKHRGQQTRLELRLFRRGTEFQQYLLRPHSQRPRTISNELIQLTSNSSSILLWPKLWDESLANSSQKSAAGISVFCT